MTERKKNILKTNNKIFMNWEFWRKKNIFYHEQDIKYLKFLIPENKKILDLGCGTGYKLNALNPSKGTGIDFSNEAIKIAKKNYKKFNFYCFDLEKKDSLNNINEKFDYILISDLIGDLEDIDNLFKNLHSFCNKETRIIISYYSALWWPILKFIEFLKLKIPSVEKNWLRSKDIENLLEISNFQIIKNEKKQLLPKRLLGFGNFVNKFIATLPIINNFCLSNYIVSRSLVFNENKELSCSIIVPCKNERGNIKNIVERIPNFCKNLEIIFVEGGSSDGTYQEIKKIKKKNRNINISFFKQDNSGKADAVIKGFNKAKNEILMILDADMTVPPEVLPKFYKLYCEGKAEFINGSRMIYPLEKDSMRFLNMIGNFLFSKIFTWLLKQRFTDTLCGTKVLSKTNFKKIEKSFKYFGNFDPFGDFLLIFGAIKENLKIVELPIKYKKRVYGRTQISRFKHGFMLLKMVIFSYFKIKAI